MRFRHLPLRCVMRWMIGFLLLAPLLVQNAVAQSVTPPTYTVTLQRDTCNIAFCNLEVAYTAGTVNGYEWPFEWISVFIFDESGNWDGLYHSYYSSGHTGVFKQPVDLRPGMTITAELIDVIAWTCWPYNYCQSATAPPYPDQVYCPPPPPASDLLVKAFAETDGNNPPIERVRSASGVSITVPLGARFRVGLEKGTLPSGTPVSSTFQLSNQIPSQPLIQLSPVYASQRLFSSYVAFAYQANVAEELKLFQAVHLGTANLHIQPLGQSGNAVDLTINVVRPARLGNSPPCVVAGAWSDSCIDSAVTDIADMSGIPPQYLKAQVEQESTGVIRQNDDRSFVYEPCRDFERLISLSRFPYSGFTAPNPRGPLLSDDDLSPRAKYSIEVTSGGRTTTRKILPTDRDVTIANIFRTNDCVYRDPRGICHGANWSKTCQRVSREIKANNYANSEIVAQTPIFSSYGRLQMLYTTAIDPPLRWSVMDPANPGIFLYNPSLLFDTGAFYFVGGGSMTEGALENVGNWYYEMENYGDPATYNVFDDFMGELAPMFHDYNRAWHSIAGSTPYYANYQSAVFDRARRFMPVRSGAILGGHQ